MIKKVKTLVIMSVLLIGIFGIAIQPSSSNGDIMNTFPRNVMAPDGLDPIDGTVDMLGSDEIAIRSKASTVGLNPMSFNKPQSISPVSIGDELNIDVADFVFGDYEETFTVVLNGVHGIILVEKAAYDNYDTSTDEFVFPNPYHPEYPEYRISMSMLTYLLGEFDNNIYDTVATVFGQPLPRGEEGQKIWILIHNIRDDSYYDPTITTYIAGYFSASEDYINNKNMMHIDAYDWQNRIGPDAARPYLYEGTFAHEYEHLIHFDIDPDEPSWVDEGLADLSAFICGYGHSQSHIAYYMVYHPFTALTFWGGNLEDYGASYLFQLYLYEHFGGASFVTALVHNQLNGIEGIESTLQEFGYTTTFDEIFDAWTIANYLDDTEKAGGMYGYKTLDFGGADSWGYTIPYVLQNFWWGYPDTAPFVYPSYWYGDPQPYTATYYQFFTNKARTAFIDGQDFAGIPAYAGTYEWYSGQGTWTWNSFHQSFSIPAGGASLNFMTWFDIEEDWDYGYVEVYDYNTMSYTTLYAPGTVDYVAYAQDNPNVPADQEPSYFASIGEWHAFTGSSNGWQSVSMDLSPFAGHNIELYFYLWQDGAFTLQNMYVDEISIPEIGFYDGAETGEDGWTVDGWSITDGILTNGISLTIIDTKWVSNDQYPLPATNSAMTLHSISTAPIDFTSQYGSVKVSATSQSSGRLKVAIITNHASHSLNSGYLFGVI